MPPDTTEELHILLVDDDPMVSWNLGQYLTRMGMKVTTCGDGSEAMTLLENETYDVLITDVQMPGLNGLALIEWVRQQRPNLCVVVITGFGSPSVRQVALKRGAIFYFEKPVDPKTLVECLKTETKTEAFTGTIHNIDLLEYVQLLLISRRQLMLEISANDGQKAHLFFDKGNIVHATLGEQNGVEAFFNCLDLEGGTFTTHDWKEPEERTITLPGDFLLMEAARKSDEADYLADSDDFYDPNAEEITEDQLFDFGGFDDSGFDDCEENSHKETS